MNKKLLLFLIILTIDFIHADVRYKCINRNASLVFKDDNTYQYYSFYNYNENVDVCVEYNHTGDFMIKNDYIELKTTSNSFEEMVIPYTVKEIIDTTLNKVLIKYDYPDSLPRIEMNRDIMTTAYQGLDYSFVIASINWFTHDYKDIRYAKIFFNDISFVPDSSFFISNDKSITFFAQPGTMNIPDSVTYKVINPKSNVFLVEVNALCKPNLSYLSYFKNTRAWFQNDTLCIPIDNNHKYIDKYVKVNQ